MTTQELRIQEAERLKPIVYEIALNKDILPTMNTPETEQQLLDQWQLHSLRIANLEDEITTHRKTIREIQEKLIWMKWNLRVGSIVTTYYHKECKVTHIPFYHGSFGKPSICIDVNGKGNSMMITTDYEIIKP